MAFSTSRRSHHPTAELNSDLPYPPLTRRLAAFLYEGVLLFGVVMLAGFVYGVGTDQRHALQGQRGLQWAIFGVLGAYFAGFWWRQGQTLAMKTWHIRLVRRDGGRCGPWRALARYLLSWVWFVPALVYVEIQGVRGGGAVSLALVSGVLMYAALSRFLPGRQFLHDHLCGTRLVDSRDTLPVRSSTQRSSARHSKIASVPAPAVERSGRTTPGP
jgi:uncharacterized RDD family membrane protein YckC